MKYFILLPQKIQFFVLFIAFLFKVSQSQGVKFQTDYLFVVSRTILLSLTIQGSSTPLSLYTITHANTFTVGNSKIIFGVTGIDFLVSAASLSYDITVQTRNAASYNFKFQILNETVIKRIYLDSAIFDTSIPNILFVEDYLIFTQLNQGIGKRSQNYSIPLNLKPVFKSETGLIKSALFVQGHNIFNPKGGYFYFFRNFYYNFSHYNIEFTTEQENIVTFVRFTFLLVDSKYSQEDLGYKRVFYINAISCNALLIEDCPGRSWQWTANTMYNLTYSYMFGLSGLNYTKNQLTHWFLDTTNISNFGQNFVQTAAANYLRFNVFIMALRQCDNSSQFFDPATFLCKASCTGGLYPFDQNIDKVCKKCHYTCNPTFCNDYPDSNCTGCDSTKFRLSTNPMGSQYKCICKDGYVDMGLQECKPCSNYIPGCVKCATPYTCQICDTDLTLTSSSKCQCVDSTKTLTRNGKCKSLMACITYFTYPNTTEVCIQCNQTLNFTLINYQCVCILGYQLSFLANGLTHVCVLSNGVCGDGIRTLLEDCDDHNNHLGDGCSPACTIEPGFLCFGDLRATSFCLESRTTLNYLSAMKLQGSTFVELYFSLKPYNEYLQNQGFLSKFLSTQISHYSSFHNPSYHTEPNLDQDQLRIQLTFEYTEAIDPKYEHVMSFSVNDQEHQFSVTTKFNIIGKNLQLLLYQGYQSFVAFNYVIQGLIILAFIATVASMFSQNWIGIELMHSFQFCFFYFALLQNIDQKQIKFLFTLQTCNGYNNISHEMSYYEYINFNQKLYIMNFRKEILLNFNYTTFVYLIPIILFVVKVVRPCVSTKKIKKVRNDGKSINKYSSKLEQYLSSQFIIGKVFVSINLIFMNQILFSYFIEQAPNIAEGQVFNGLFEQIFIFLMISCVLTTIGLLMVAALRPYKLDADEDAQRMLEVVDFIKFKRFQSFYPFVYSVYTMFRIIFVALFFVNPFAVFVMWGFQITYLIGYVIIRPYQKTRKNQTDYCYILHNLHNIWISLGLCILLGVMLMQNKKVNPDSYIMNVSIRFTILIIQAVSLTFAYLRLFVSKKFAQFYCKCLKKQQSSQELPDKEINQTARQLKRDIPQQQRKRNNMSKVTEQKKQNRLSSSRKKKVLYKREAETQNKDQRFQKQETIGQQKIIYQQKPITKEKSIERKKTFKEQNQQKVQKSLYQQFNEQKKVKKKKKKAIS